MPYFNRAGLLNNMRARILNDRMVAHVITGPRSSGKSAAVAELLSKYPGPTLQLDCRAMDTSNKKDFLKQVRDQLDQEARDFRPRMHKVAGLVLSKNKDALPDMMAGMKPLVQNYFEVNDQQAVTLTKLGEQAIRDIEAKLKAGADKTDNFMMAIGRVIESASAHKLPMVFFVDELNLMQSKGNPDLQWRDHFTENLQHLMICNTKQRPRMTAVVATTDQHYAEAFASMPDFRMHCMGHMDRETAHEFLKVPWDGSPAVAEEADRNRIMDAVGTFAPELIRARHHVARGELDDFVDEAKYDAMETVRGRLAKKGDYKWTVERHMALLAPQLLDRGFIPEREAAKKVGSEAALRSLVNGDFLQRRHPMTKGDLWAPDLPAEAHSQLVVTPYLPMDRMWLKQLA